MKFKVAFCLFVSFYIAQVNSTRETNLAEHNVAIYRSKSHIQAVVGRIFQTKHDLQSSTVSKLNALSHKTEETIQKLLQDAARQNLRISDKAKKNRKNLAVAEKCFNNSKTGVISVKSNTERRLKKCVTDVKDLLTKYMYTLDVIENNGKQLVHDLDSISRSCAVGNPQSVKLCFGKRLRSSNEAAGAFEVSFSDKKANAYKGSKEALSAAERCNAAAIAATKSALDFVQEELIKCLKNS